jgi:hydrogenase expression/formation protein HypC
MQLVDMEGPSTALCRSVDGEIVRRVDLTLVSDVLQPGDWILAHIDVALRQLGSSEAQQIHDALSAVTAAANGLPFEHLIQDLVDREPQLPAHLQARSDPVASTEEIGDD